MGYITVESLTFAVIGGLIPALIWLFFWLEEDCHPEPKRLLFYAFLGGVFAIPPALALSIGWERFVVPLFYSPRSAVLGLLLGLAFIEELCKYAMTKQIIFWRSDYNEPVDAMVYLITAALGFAAVENILYLIPEFAQSFSLGIITGNLRFLGATLLHVLASGTLGFFIAHQFCSDRIRQRIALVWGLLGATLVHATFNVVMLYTTGERLAPILLLLGIIGLCTILAFDHIKKVHQTCPVTNKCRGRNGVAVQNR